MNNEEVQALKEIANELKKVRKRVTCFIVLYVIFWGLVILSIHLFMIPAIRGD